MKTCPSCKNPNGPRAATCSKCAKPFPGHVAKPTTKPKWTPAPVATVKQPKPKTSGSVVDLVEALVTAERMLDGFEPNDDIDGAKAHLARARAIVRSLHAA